jgi:anti-anti-sigma regulatory factor
MDAVSRLGSDPLPPICPPTMAYRVSGAAVIAASGAMRSPDVVALDRLLIEALDKGHHNLVLDLHQVSTIEPEALGLLWATLRGIRRRGGTLVGEGARPPLRPALEALSSGGLTLHTSVRAALAGTRDTCARS